MTLARWDDVWRRASAAADDPVHHGPEVAAVAVDRRHATVLDVQGNSARLLVLRRTPDGFESWGEPVAEGMRELATGSFDRLLWLAGPLRIDAGDRTAVWAVAGKLSSEPASDLRARVGTASAVGSVSYPHFAAIVSGTALTDAEIRLNASFAGAPDWSLELPAANSISSTEPTEPP